MADIKLDTDAVTQEDLENLRHALGATKHISRKVWGFRRHFAASPGTPDHASMLRLVAAGFMIPGREDPESKLAFFFATESGCKALLFDVAQTSRAMEDVWKLDAKKAQETARA